MDEQEKKINILCLGPKGSGKTTLLKKLQNADGVDYTYSPVPTIGTNIYDINYVNKNGKKQVVSIREVGGEMAALWGNYLVGVEKVSDSYTDSVLDRLRTIRSLETERTHITHNTFLLLYS